jgi:ribonucleotide reductase alpha subunit
MHEYRKLSDSLADGGAQSPLVIGGNGGAQSPLVIGGNGGAQAPLVIGGNGGAQSPPAAKQQLTQMQRDYFIIPEELQLLRQYAGAYSSFIGSPAHAGKLQFDLWGSNSASPDDAEIAVKTTLDWATLKSDIAKHGMRNSLLIALMPTASTSQINGCNECFEPFTNNIYTRRTLAGSFTVINKYLITDLLELGLWTSEMKDKIILANGSIQHIPEIPTNIKLLYRTVWELSQRSIIDLAADRAPFIDQTQSMNLWLQDPTYQSLTSMHFYGWQKGLKTGIYYLRSQAKSAAQKFSVDIDLQQPLPSPLISTSLLQPQRIVVPSTLISDGITLASASAAATNDDTESDEVCSMCSA